LTGKLCNDPTCEKTREGIRHSHDISNNVTQKSEIFDNKIEKYVIKWEDFGDGQGLNAEIQKSDGTKIAETKPEGSIRKKTVLFDFDGSVALTAHKAMSMYAKYEIKDSDNNKIGNAGHYGLAWTVHMTWKNPKGKKILIIKTIGKTILTGLKEGHVIGVREINTMDDRNIAKFEVTRKKVERSFWKSDYYYTCIIQIYDLDFDRKCIIGLVIAYLASFFDVRHSQ